MKISFIVNELTNPVTEQNVIQHVNLASYVMAFIALRSWIHDRFTLYSNDNEDKHNAQQI